MPLCSRPTTRCTLSLLDHLVGAGKDRGLHGQSERLGGLEVNNQLECRRLLDWQIGRLRAVEDPAGVNTGLTPDREIVNSIADQATDRREIAQPVARRNGMAR